MSIPSIMLTTWETCSEKGAADKMADKVLESMTGWHTYMVQVAKGQVKYFIDGVPQASHGDKYYPETPMSIRYNLWFIEGGLTQDSEMRKYIQQADWILFAQNEVLTPAQVDQKVTAYRSASIRFEDTVPAWTPPPASEPSAVPAPTPVPKAALPF